MNNESAEIEAFAQLFGLSDDIQIIEHDGALARAMTSSNLMDFGCRRKTLQVAGDDLTDGLAHLDLLEGLR